MLFDYKALSKLGALLLALGSISVSADKIHDPTLPKINLNVADNNTVQAMSNEALSLQGIVNKKGAKMAILSGQLHRVGDVVNGFKISQINNNNIVLLKSGSQKRLYVYEK